MINSVAAKLRIKALLIRFEDESESILENVYRSERFKKANMFEDAHEIDEAVRLYTIKNMGLE